jgi:hypothetical protein
MEILKSLSRLRTELSNQLGQFLSIPYYIWFMVDGSQKYISNPKKSKHHVLILRSIGRRNASLAWFSNTKMI